jgi:predicted adenine nucleotide alpha hydrolase (AANH) superfamily ATPase
MPSSIHPARDRLAHMKTLALHTCCGPCLIEPFAILRVKFDRVTVFFCNSNIDPEDEYAKRRDTCSAYAKSQGIAFVEHGYEPDVWNQRIAALDTTVDRSLRCRQCYALRFENVLQKAKEEGFTHFATTLTVSPYQYRDLIGSVALGLCNQYGLEYAGSDFSAHYPDATRKSRELGMYRQNYCGCRFSHEEARRERTESRMRSLSQGSLD